MDGDILGIQATGASGDNNNDANQPGLPDDGTCDGEDEEEVESDEPGGTAQGQEDTVVWVRNVEGEEDLKNQEIHPCDNQLMSVYGDTIHRNDGRHMDGGVANNSVWQYNLPKGGLGHRVVSTMAKEFVGVRERRWN